MPSTAERLFGLCPVDLPRPGPVLLEFARRSDWRPATTQVLLTRPAAWADPGETLRTLDTIFEETSDREALFAAGIVHSACMGLARSLAGGNQRGILALVFVSALTRRGFRPDDVPALLGAVRAASTERGFGDPLVECGRALWRCLDGVIPREVAGPLLLDLTTDIPPEDRQTLLPK